MKKIIAILCALTLMFSTLIPVEVFAARGETGSNAWEGWTASGKNASIKDGIGRLTSDGSGTSNLLYKWANQPTKLTMSFSMRVNGVSSSMGMWICDGIARAGFYIQSNRVMSMDTGEFIMVPDMGNWHDYVLEVDMEAKIQHLYVDEVLMGTTSLKQKDPKGTVNIWAEQSGADFEIENISFMSNVAETDEERLQLTEEYTEPFFFDFDSQGGWTYETPKSVTRNDEEGIIRLSSGPLFGDLTTQTLHTLERPLRPPTNYDMEWRMKLSDIHAMGGQPAMTSLELSTDNRHAWLYIYENRIWHNGYSLDDDVHDGYGFPYSAQDDEWHTWKAEVRGQYISWYVDDELLITYEMLNKETNRWHVCMWQQHNITLSGDAFFDWIRYTPYFENVTITSPKNHSQIAESKNITLQASAPVGTEYVDYYIGDVAVGRGYAPNYEYVLENAKLGTYEVYAKVGDKQSSKTTIYVKRAFDASVKISNNNIKQGGSVTAQLETTHISQQTKAVKADYYVNGKKIASSNKAPFKVSLNDFKVGTASIYARVTNAEGTVLDTETVYVDVDEANGKKLKIGREYQVDYTYKSGTGKFELTDGYFKYSITHTKDKISYETIDGTEEYKLGEGEYKAVVTSGYAEVYHNGQFAFSFFMPRSDAEVKKTTFGLKDVNLSASGVKAEIWSKDWKGEAKFVADDVPNTQYYSLEFDKTDASEETLIFYDGMFENEIFFREDGLYVNRQLTFQVPKTELKIADSYKPGYYRVTVGFGIAQIFCDNKFVGSYRCFKAGHKPQLIREMTNPSASTIMVIKNSDDVFYHTEDFEGNNEFSYNDYFQTRVGHQNDGDKHSLTQTKGTKNGNSYVKIEGTGTYMLNGNAKNPVFKFRAMTEKRKGKIYFTVRRTAHRDQQDRIGYDFETEQWYFDEYDENRKYQTIATKKDSNAFAANKWYEFEIKFDDRMVTLFCNGKEVISGEEAGTYVEVYYGRPGFGAENGTMCIDDIYYEGENRVTAGLVINHSLQYENMGMTSSFYQNGDGAIVATGFTAASETTDNGNNWKVELASNTSNETATQLVTMPNGDLVKVTGDFKMVSSRSKDGGKSWSTPVRLWGDDFQPFKNPSVSVSRLTATKDGKLYLVTSQGDEDYGYSDIWYSLDGGESWNKSETVLTTHNTGIIMNEAIIVDTPRENEVWFYGRSDSGFLDYWISYDNGKTFDLTPHHTQLIQSETCYKVIRDWNYDNVYYAIFHYDTETSNERGQQMPRNKTSLAVSYDGMETWEYITDVMETNMYPSLHTSDSNVALLDNHLYYRASDYGVGDIIGSQDVSLIKTLKRHPQLHERFFLGAEVRADYAVDYSVVPKNGGAAWIYNGYYNTTVQEGRADLASIGRIFGVDAVKVSGGVELKTGDAVVKFSENSKEYTINGQPATSETVCYKNGCLDLEICAKIFGKVFHESEDSYAIMHNSVLVDQYQKQIDTFAK
ncbi:MAG: hypothetical protein IKW64_05975 [Clostridia bacterium]|nr:hypothetical protein [Clostridia bacterium]